MNRNATRFWLAALAIALLFCYCSSADACCCCREHADEKQVTYTAHHQTHAGQQAQQQPLYGYPVWYRTPWYPGKRLVRGLGAAAGYPVGPVYRYGYLAPAPHPRW